MDLEDTSGEKFPIWLQLIKPKRKRRKTKQAIPEKDAVQEQDMTAYLPTEPNLSVHQLLTQSIILLLRENEYKNPSSFDQLLRLCIQSVRSRDEIMDMFDYRFDDKFDEEAVIGKLLTTTLGVLQTLGLVQQLPGPPHKYQLMRAQEIVIRDIPQYIDNLVSKRNENEELREEEARQLSILAKKGGLKIDLTQSLSKRAVPLIKASDVFLPGRLKLVPEDVEKEIVRRNKLSRREDHSKKSVSRRNYPKMSEEARKVRLAVRKAQKEVFASCADHKSSEFLPRMDSSDPYISGTSGGKTPRAKNQYRGRNGRFGTASSHSSSSPRHTKVTASVQGSPEELEKRIKSTKSTLKGFAGGGDEILTTPILFDEITPQFKLVGEKSLAETQPSTPRTSGSPAFQRTASLMSMSSVTSGVDVDIPSFRVHDWKDEVSEGEAETEEDLSDETLLARHDKSLEELNAKWTAALEDRKRQKQEARDKAKIARLNSKSPRSRRDNVALEKQSGRSPFPQKPAPKAKSSTKLLAPVAITTVDSPGVVEESIASRSRSRTKETSEKKPGGEVEGSEDKDETSSKATVKKEEPSEAAAQTKPKPKPKSKQQQKPKSKPKPKPKPKPEPEPTSADEDEKETEEQPPQKPLTRAARAAANERVKSEQSVTLRRSSRKRVRSKR